MCVAQFMLIVKLAIHGPNLNITVHNASDCSVLWKEPNGEEKVIEPKKQ
jgi:hypothetical protein